MSLYILDRNLYNGPAKPSTSVTSFPGMNPYKGHRKVKDEEKVPPAVKEKYVEHILDLVLYDVENCEALRNFETLQRNTHCTFAKNSFLWGARDYDQSLSLGELL